MDLFWVCVSKSSGFWVSMSSGFWVTMSSGFCVSESRSSKFEMLLPSDALVSSEENV